MPLSHNKLIEIINLLNTTFFTSSQFNIITNGDNNLLVKIVYQNNDLYYISLVKRSKDIFALNQHLDKNFKQDTFNVAEMSPGELEEYEEAEIKEYSHFTQHILEWVERLKMIESSNANDIDTQLRDIQMKYDDAINQHCTDNERHFTEGEKLEIHERLRKLEEAFLERFKNDDSKKDEVVKMVGEMNLAVDTMPKKVFLKTLISRIALISRIGLTNTDTVNGLITSAIDAIKLLTN